MVTDDPFAKGAVRVVVDPNALDPSGSTSIDWYTPSHDGKLVAVGGKADAWVVLAFYPTAATPG